MAKEKQELNVAEKIRLLELARAIRTDNIRHVSFTQDQIISYTADDAVNTAKKLKAFIEEV